MQIDATKIFQVHTYKFHKVSHRFLRKVLSKVVGHIINRHVFTIAMQQVRARKIIQPNQHHKRWVVNQIYRNPYPHQPELRGIFLFVMVFTSEVFSLMNSITRCAFVRESKQLKDHRSHVYVCRHDKTRKSTWLIPFFTRVVYQLNYQLFRWNCTYSLQTKVLTMNKMEYHY